MFFSVFGLRKYNCGTITKIRQKHLLMLHRKLIIILVIVYPVFFGFLLNKPVHGSETIIKPLSSVEEVYPEKPTELSIKEDPVVGDITETKSIHVPILIYHSVSPHHPGESPVVKYYNVDPKIFEKQLIYLRDGGYNVISMSDLANALYGRETLPPKPVIITFDDGWKSQYIYAFPLLKKYHDTALFYIYTNVTDHERFMTWEDIKKMDEEGMTIGGHTRSHPYLTDIKNRAQLQDEIMVGKKILEEHLGKTVDHFAYPFGHYSSDAISVVKEAGYKSARSTYVGTHHTLDDLYTLKGGEVSDDFDAFVDLISY